MATPHLSLLVHYQADRYGDRVALNYKDYTLGKWLPVTWRQFSKCVSSAANSLVEMGVEEQENIGVFSQNKPECLYVDFACFANRAVTVPMYPTSSESQIKYVINDAKIRILFVGEQSQYDVAIKVFPLCDSLKELVIFDSSVKKAVNDYISIYFDEFIQLDEHRCHSETVAERTNRASENDLANVLYTSGTTGEAKGVMLHHSCFTEAFRLYSDHLSGITDSDVSLSFLPMSHVFEKGWSYFCLFKGVTTYINLRPTEIQESIKEVRPTLMCAVPRFWEKIYIAAHEKIEEITGLKHWLMLDAIRVGKIHNIDYLRVDKKPPLLIKLKYLFYEKTIFSILKKTIGLENGHYFPTGGAALSNEVCEFIHSVGIPLIVGYGLTESTATGACSRLKGYTIGSAGEIMDGVDVKIGVNNEILLKGKIVTKGYYNKPDITASCFIDDGWFRTGDAGYIKNGELYITDRIKDLFKTSNGKYIAPQALETKLVIDRYIDQIAIVADQRKFVSALVVPVFSLLKEYADDNNILYANTTDLLTHPQIKAFIKARIDALQQGFASYEQVKDFALLSTPFSMEKGELTNTMKLKRAIINNHFKEEIDKIYCD